MANTAVISKMIRVMMLAPFLLMLSWLLTRSKWSIRKYVTQNYNSLVLLYFFLLVLRFLILFDLLPKRTLLVNLLVEIDVDSEWSHQWLTA